MVFKKIADSLVKWREKQQGKAVTKREALSAFLERLNTAFPVLPHPRRVTSETVLILRILRAKNAVSKVALQEELKKFSVDAPLVADLSVLYFENKSRFIRYAIATIEKRDGVYVSQVKPVDVFSRVIVAMRTLYADDIADHILVRDVVQIIAEKVFECH